MSQLIFFFGSRGRQGGGGGGVGLAGPQQFVESAT